MADYLDRPDLEKLWRETKDPAVIAVAIRLCANTYAPPLWLCEAVEEFFETEYGLPRRHKK